MKILNKVFFAATNVASFLMTGAGAYYTVVEPVPTLSLPFVFLGGSYFTLSAYLMLTERRSYLKIDCSCEHEEPTINQQQNKSVELVVSQQMPAQSKANIQRPKTQIQLRNSIDNANLEVNYSISEIEEESKKSEEPSLQEVKKETKKDAVKPLLDKEVKSLDMGKDFSKRVAESRKKIENSVNLSNYLGENITDIARPTQKTANNGEDENDMPHRRRLSRQRRNSENLLGVKQ